MQKDVAAHSFEPVRFLAARNRDPSDPDETPVYKVMVGSGMGQLCSDECSSSSFYIKAEKSFALDPVVRRRYGIMEYLRFKDDILVIASGPRVRHEPFFKNYSRGQAAIN